MHSSGQAATPRPVAVKAPAQGSLPEIMLKDFLTPDLADDDLFGERNCFGITLSWQEAGAVEICGATSGCSILEKKSLISCTALLSSSSVALRLWIFEIQHRLHRFAWSGNSSQKT